QTEAMTMASRIVVMKDGIIHQVGAPKYIYDNPENVFVGGFIGSPSMNFLDGRVEDGYYQLGDRKIIIPEDKMTMLRQQGYVGKEVILGIRPESFFVGEETAELDPSVVSQYEIEVAELTGSEIMLYFRIGDQEVVALTDAQQTIEAGQKINLAVNTNKMHFFDKETEIRIR